MEESNDVNYYNSLFSGTPNLEEEEDPRVREAIATVSPNPAGESSTLLAQAVKERAAEMHKRRLEGKTQAELSKDFPNLEAIQALAARYAEEPEPEEVEEVVQEAFLAQEKPGRRAQLEANFQRARSDRLTNLAAIRDILEREIASNQRNRLAASEVKGSPLASAALYTGKTVAQFLMTEIFQNSENTLISLIQKVAPELNITQADFLQPADAKNAFARLITQTSPEQSKKIMKAFIKQLRIASRGNDYEYGFHLEELARYIEAENQSDPSRIANVFSVINSVAAGLDVASAGLALGATAPVRAVAGAIGRKAAPAVKHLFKQPEGSLADVIGNTIEGAKVVGEAAGNAAVAKATGINQVPAVSASLPKLNALITDNPIQYVKPKPAGGTQAVAGPSIPAAPVADAPLPKDLAEAKVSYSYGKTKFDEVNFTSEADKALFITSQGKKSTRDADYRKYLEGLGLTSKEIDELGKTVRDAAKAQAKVQKGLGDTARLDVPAVYSAPAKAAQAAPTPSTAPLLNPDKPIVAASRPNTELSATARLLGTSNPIVRPGTGGVDVLAQAASRPPATILEEAIEEAPKGAIPLSGTPFYDLWYLKPEDIAAKQARIEAGFEKHSVRANDTQISRTEMGLEIKSVIGDVDGVGWATKAEAEKFAAANFDPATTIIQQDRLGAWNIVYKQEFFVGADDFTDLAGYVLKGPLLSFGKAAKFQGWFADASGVAEKISNVQLAQNRRLVEAIRKLSAKEQREVFDVLAKGETAVRADGGIGIDYSTATLQNTFGLNARQIFAYNQDRALHRIAWQEENLGVYQKLTSRGFKYEMTVEGSRVFAKKLDGELPIDILLDKRSKSIDLLTGQRISVADTKVSDYTVYRFFEDTEKNGYSYGFLRNGGSYPISPITDTPLKYVQGYRKRIYDAPFFIRRIKDTPELRSSSGAVVPGSGELAESVMTARSKEAGAEAIARLKAADPSGDYRLFRRDELSDEAQSLGDLESLRAQGRLVTSNRHPLPLPDADGGTRLAPVLEGIEQMLLSNAGQRGIGRWTQAMEIYFNNTYGKKLNFTMDLARAPIRPSEIGANAELYNEARAFYDYVRMVNGLHESNTLGRVSAGIVDSIADLFYSAARASDQAKIPALGTVSEFVGNQVATGAQKSVAAVKNAAVVTWLALNPIVMLPLQAAVATTYAGIRGAAGYAASGRWARDQLILSLAKWPRSLAAASKAFGFDSAYAKALVRDWKASGGAEAVDNHILIAGTFSDARNAASSRLGEYAAAVPNALMRIGQKKGVSIEKQAAWLVARNRYMLDNNIKNGAITAEGYKRIAQDAEGISGHLGPSDPLSTPGTLMSHFAQFLTPLLKATFRLAGATVGSVTDVTTKGKTKLFTENALSRAEQRRVIGVGLAMGGLGGFGLVDYIDKEDEKNGWGLPQEAKLVIREGLGGSIINMMFGLADQDDTADSSGKPLDTNLLASYRYSPFTLPAAMYKSIGHIYTSVMEGNFNQALNFLPSPAAAGFVGKSLDTAKFFWHLGGMSENFENAEVALLAVQEIARFIPITDKALQAHMAANMNMKYNRQGSPTVRLALGSAIAMNFGFMDKREQDYYNANKAISGVFEPISGIALEERLDKAAHDAAEWLLPMLHGVMKDEAGGIDAARASELIEKMNLAYHTRLEKTEYVYFRNKLAQIIMNNPSIKEDKLLEKIAERIGAGKIAPSETLMDKLSGMDLPYMDEVQSFVRSAYNDLLKSEEAREDAR